MGTRRIKPRPVHRKEHYHESEIGVAYDMRKLDLKRNPDKLRTVYDHSSPGIGVESGLEKRYPTCMNILIYANYWYSD